MERPQDSCDAREAALIHDGEEVQVGSGCKVSSGNWYDPYTARTYTDPQEIDIDHVVPLARLEPLVERSDPEELGIVRLLPYLAWAYLELGDDDRAKEVVLEGIERARAQGHRLGLVELLRMRGMVLARRRGWDEAERAFEEAVSVARSIRYPYAAARALYEWGLMYVGRPEPKQGQDRLEKAANIFRGLGSRPYSERAQKAMAGLG